MTQGGRPLRFLALVLCSWIGARVAILWPQTGSLPEALRQVVPLAARPQQPAGPAAIAPPVPPRRPAVRAESRAPLPPRVAIVAPVAIPAGDALRVQMALLGATHFGFAHAADVPAMAPTPWQPGAPPALPDRWSASAWIVARPGTGIGAAPIAGQLGGSQAGGRIAFLLAPDRRLAAVARLTAPLRGRGAEASIGLEWQPTRLPVRIVAERRFGLDGIAGGWGVGAIAGGDAAMPAGFRLESYGQAGILRRERTEPYADGAVRITRPVAAVAGLRLALGVGAWGAAQRDAARLDIGPSATLSWQGVRLSADWRQRIAGDARPGSGPALSIGTDF